MIGQVARAHIQATQGQFPRTNEPQRRWRHELVVYFGPCRQVAANGSTRTPCRSKTALQT